MSGKYPTLPNAPIKEAIVDIRCILPKGFNIDQFNSIGAKIANDYPMQQTMKLHETVIDLKDYERSVKTRDRINGYKCQSSDHTKIVQLRDNGFTFNRLKPYKNWEDVRDEALRLWSLYKELAEPVSINRVALRYINNLNIPMPINDFADYLTCPPEVPKGLPQGISSFFYKVVIPFDDSRITAIITQAFEPKVDSKHNLPIILDIDVFKFTLDGLLEEDILRILEKLRNFKNQIFFKTITKKLIETYK
jgi:uncharacterized protein (TIGR04255 family)